MCLCFWVFYVTNVMLLFFRFFVFFRGPPSLFRPLVVSISRMSPYPEYINFAKLSYFFKSCKVLGRNKYLLTSEALQIFFPSTNSDQLSGRGPTKKIKPNPNPYPSTSPTCWEWPPLITKSYLNNLVTRYLWFDLKI